MPAEVLIIGAGPVGLTTAILLARLGLRVDLIEKRTEPSSDPRAVALDDEALRTWQRCGLSDLLREDCVSGTPGQIICTYLDAHDRPFLRLHQRNGDCGHPHAVAIHQGRIEQKLLHAISRSPGLRLHRGVRVHTLHQTPHAVVVRASDPDGRTIELSAPWAIACDGARSIARSCAGIEMRGDVLPNPWLVANLVDRGEPGHATIRCRPDNAAVTMPLPHAMRRVEVQLPVGDDGAWIDDDAEVRARLKFGWPGAAEAPIASRAVCRFSALIAQKWREGRLFLAGDAAHVMPPFAGQGLASGLRDAANLSFKLAGVVQGWLGESVLDSYEEERRPHVEHITTLARRLGRLMMPRSRIESTCLQSALRALGATPLLRRRWSLRGPDLHPTPRSGFFVASTGAGRYLPQPDVLASDLRRVPLDDLLGPRMTWIVLAGNRRAGPQLKHPLLHPSDTVLMEGREFRDPQLTLRRRYGAGSLILVRPDRVVYIHLPPKRTSLSRSSPCRSDPPSAPEPRGASPCSCSPSSPAPDASPTAPTPAPNSTRRRPTRSTPLSAST